MMELKVLTLGPQIGENWGFALKFLVGTYMNTAIGHNQFPKIPRSVANLGENQLRYVEKNLWTEKKTKT